MVKKKGKRREGPAPKPKALRKHLRRQLRKAEADLGKAVAKRDKAQARVEALSIIADEIRAQMADIDKAAAKAAAASTADKAAPAKTASRSAAEASDVNPVTVEPTDTKPVTAEPTDTEPPATEAPTARKVAPSSDDSASAPSRVTAAAKRVVTSSRVRPRRTSPKALPQS